MLLGALGLLAATSLVAASAGSGPKARIFEVSAARIQKNALASPVTLKAFLDDDTGLKELGGPAYLVRLAGAEPMPSTSRSPSLSMSPQATPAPGMLSSPRPAPGPKPEAPSWR